MISRPCGKARRILTVWEARAFAQTDGVEALIATMTGTPMALPRRAHGDCPAGRRGWARSLTSLRRNCLITESSARGAHDRKPQPDFAVSTCRRSHRARSRAAAAGAGLPRAVVLSLAPKSVTAQVAMGISESLQADPSLTAVAVVLTGILVRSSSRP